MAETARQNNIDPKSYGPKKPEIVTVYEIFKDFSPKNNSADHLFHKTYAEKYPTFRFIGKCYSDKDRINGSFGHCWDIFFNENQPEIISRNIVSPITWDDSDSYVGLMRCCGDDPFVYAVGMFVPADTPVPEGFISYDFPESTLGICQLHGFDAELYAHEPEVAIRLENEGYTITTDEHGAYWFFERYVLSRYAEPDEDGHQTLDIGFFVKNGKTEN